MKYPFIIIVKGLHVRGMALFPFLLFRNRQLSADAVMLNHEMIHHRQQVELLIIPFYVLYLINYLFNRWRYTNHHDAYRNIIFEREAYANDQDLQYLRQRRWFAFCQYR
ncbi:MAG: hypothetical protein K1X61_06130 [Chitinophagales bacterium]|nr:hypothetical protein [Chitinophagales bacterium]